MTWQIATVLTIPGITLLLFVSVRILARMVILLELVVGLILTGQVLPARWGAR